jgi:hypothetical protein
MSNYITLFVFVYIYLSIKVDEILLCLFKTLREEIIVCKSSNHNDEIFKMMCLPVQFMFSEFLSFKRPSTTMRSSFRTCVFFEQSSRNDDFRSQLPTPFADRTHFLKLFDRFSKQNGIGDLISTSSSLLLTCNH